MATVPRNIRDDFPIFSQNELGDKLVFLDSAASTQKPEVVISTLANYYRTSHANIHRGVYELSAKATQLHDGARSRVQQFLGAQYPEEIIFTRGTTESINLVVHCLGKKVLSPDKNVVVSILEHHANFVPWQMLCKETGAELRVIPIDSSGELDRDQALSLIDSQTSFLALGHISNSLGTINPVTELVQWAKRVGAYTLIDGAQSVAHLPVDVQALDCDFYAFSGHKIFAPTGIGVLYGKKEHLASMPPYQYGGDMIRKVSIKETLFNALPYKFEAGTPDIGGAIALASAVDYVLQIGWEWIQEHSKVMLTYATEKLSSVPGLTIIGQGGAKAPIISFTLEGIHPHDVGTLLNEKGIALRTGHHCTMPLMEFLGIPGTSRASFSIYNTQEDIDKLVSGIYYVQQIFS